MSTATQQKTSITKRPDLQRRWVLIDMQDQVLGRAASKIASILAGKTKPIYSHSTDVGDFVIAINVDKIRLTGNKIDQKVSFHHTAWPGGARIVPFRKLMTEKPERALQLAVKRMLPKNKLASRQILRLKMYRGDTHPHLAQQPKKLEGI